MFDFYTISVAGKFQPNTERLCKECSISKSEDETEITLACDNNYNNYMEIHKRSHEILYTLQMVIIPRAISKFKIYVNMCSDEELSTILNNKSDTPDEWEDPWLTNDLIHRIYKWAKDIVPTFTRAWLDIDTINKMSLNNYEDSVFHEYDSSDPNFIKNRLEGDYRRTIFAYGNGKPSEEVERQMLNTRSDDYRSYIRIPCKKQGTVNEKNFLNTFKLIDIQKMGIAVNTFIDKQLLEGVLFRYPSSRIFMLFESFDVFVGLKSIASETNAVSALHCGVEEGRVFKTHSIVACTGDPLVNKEGSKCVPDFNKKVFRKSGTSCEEPFEASDEINDCCVLDVSKYNIGSIMNMHHFRTKNPTTNPGYLNEAYEWYSSLFPMKADFYIPSIDSEKWTSYKIYRPFCETLDIVLESTDQYNEMFSLLKEDLKSKKIHDLNIEYSSSIVPIEISSIIKDRSINSSVYNTSTYDMGVEITMSDINGIKNFMEHPNQSNYEITVTIKCDEVDNFINRINHSFERSGYSGSDENSLNSFDRGGSLTYKSGHLKFTFKYEYPNMVINARAGIPFTAFKEWKKSNPII